MQSAIKNRAINQKPSPRTSRRCFLYGCCCLIRGPKTRLLVFFCPWRCKVPLLACSHVGCGRDTTCWGSPQCPELLSSSRVSSCGVAECWMLLHTGRHVRRSPLCTTDYLRVVLLRLPQPRLHPQKPSDFPMKAARCATPPPRPPPFWGYQRLSRRKVRIGGRRVGVLANSGFISRIQVSSFTTLLLIS